MSNLERITRLCRECAVSVYGSRQPSPIYANAVANLLIGTAATESALTARRQHGYQLDEGGGAWGLWQTEGLPLGDNITYLKRRDDVRARAARFLLGPYEEDMQGILTMGTHGLLHALHDWDRLAVLMARIHYYRFPGAVPETIQGQAEYYKAHYNTVAGKGSVKKYRTDWDRLIAPAITAHEGKE